MSFREHARVARVFSIRLDRNASLKKKKSNRVEEAPEGIRAKCIVLPLPHPCSAEGGMVDRGGRDVTRRGVSRERADLERAGVSRGVSARAEGVRTRRATLARLASARAPRERANPNDPRDACICIFARWFRRPVTKKKPPFDRSRGRTFVADVLQQTLRRGVRRGVLHHEQNLRSGAGRRGKSKRRGVSRRSSTGLGECLAGKRR